VPDAPRRVEELTRQESFRLLGSVTIGRIVYTRQALPAIRPIRHLVDRGGVVVHTHLGFELDATGVVVAYQADEIDTEQHVGWSVIITGIARPVTDSGDPRYQDLRCPWVSGPRDQTIRVEPELVTGYRLSMVPAAHTVP
jgi:hypothetical protein